MESRILRWQSIVIQYFVMTVAVIISAIGIIVFLAPFDIAPSGIRHCCYLKQDYRHTHRSDDLCSQCGIQLLAYGFFQKLGVSLPDGIVLIVLFFMLDWLLSTFRPRRKR
jgi:hypothetical protein